MTTATTDRNTREVNGRARAFPMAAATKVYAGTIAALNSSGQVTKGATATNLRAVGMFQQSYDNSSGAAGEVTAEVASGFFGPFANSTAGDAITVADIGATAYMVDDQTVAKTDGGGTRSPAGVIWQLDNGVWLKIG